MRTMFGIILIHAAATLGVVVQDSRPAVPVTFQLSLSDAPNPWYVAGRPASLRIVAVDSLGRPAPMAGLTATLKTSDARSRLNDLQVPLANGVAVVRVQWYSPGVHAIDAVSKQGIRGRIGGVKVEALPDDIKIELTTPQAWPRYVRGNSGIRIEGRVASKGKPVPSIDLSFAASKGVRSFPRDCHTDEIGGAFKAALFTPVLVCLPGGGETIQGRTPMSIDCFIDADGNGRLDPGEPCRDLPDAVIVEGCPQDEIAVAHFLLSILAEGGVATPPETDLGDLILSPPLGPGPAVREKNRIEQAKERLEKEVIEFVNSGAWKGRFSDVSKRIRKIIALLGGIAAAEDIVMILECAARLTEANPDVGKIELDLVELNGKFTVHVSYRDLVRMILNALKGKRRLSNLDFNDCMKPRARAVRTVGPGAGRAVEDPAVEQPAFEFDCDGPGMVKLEIELAYQPAAAVIIDDGHGAASQRVSAPSSNLSTLVVDFATTERFEILQDPPDIDADTDRDGTVEANQDDDRNEEQPVRYLSPRGALVFANVDNDARALDRDLKNETIDGGDDILDVVPIVIRRIPNLAAGARVVLSVDDPMAVRVFESRTVGAATFIGPNTSAVKEIPRAQIMAGDVVLGLEGILNGREVVLNVSIVQAGRIVSFDETRVLVTPWLMTSNVDVAEEVLVTRWPARTQPTDRDNSVFLADLAPKLRRAIRAGGVTLVDGKLDPAVIAEFIQDPLEFGYQKIRGSTPGSTRTMPVAADLPYDANTSVSHGSFAESRFLAPDRGVVFIEPAVDPSGRGANFGGNLELIPPFANQPLGLAVTGDNAAEGIRNWFRMNRLQTKAPNSASSEMLFLPFNSAQTNIDHVDEVMNVVPRPGGGFTILLGDMRRALLSIPPSGSPLGDRLVPYRVLEDDVDRADSTLSAIRDELVGAGVDESSIVRIPVFYPLPSDPELNDEFGLPNSINLQVVNGVVFVPEPAMDDPTDPTHALKIPLTSMRNDIARQLRAAGVPAGRIQFVDTRELWFFGGEVHCATNARRTPPQ